MNFIEETGSSSKNFLATVVDFDSATSTYILAPVDGSGTIKGAVSLWDKVDDTNKAYSFTPKSLRALSICTECNGIPIILGQFPPINVNDSGEESYNNTPYNFTPSSMSTEGLAPGDSMTTNATGGFTKSSDTMLQTVMIPGKLYTEMNTVANTMRIGAGSFTLESDACTVDFLGSNDGSTGDVHISVKRAPGETPGTVELWMGTTGDVLKITINGEQFIHVDQDRNVQIEAKDINIKVNDVDIKCNDIKLESNNITAKTGTIDVESKTVQVEAGSNNIILACGTLDLTSCNTIKM